jgi:ACS family hexuronate transporter-like MFS transporter
MYLKPEERALGAAVNQIGLSFGLAIAPLWIPLASTHSWRLPFMITGSVGFIWIPIWIVINRMFPPEYSSEPASHVVELALLWDHSLVVLVIANVLWMGAYSLWSNWTTLYLVHVHHLTLQQSAHYVWIPPLISNLGGFFGGWLSLRWMKQHVGAVHARRKAVWVSVVGSLATLLLPFATDATWATAIISISFFFVLSGSVNIYALPIDLFGPARSGLAIAALTCGFGVLQTVISPIIGYLGDHQLYNQTVWIVTLPLVLSALALQRIRQH